MVSKKIKRNRAWICVETWGFKGGYLGGQPSGSIIKSRAEKAFMVSVSVQRGVGGGVWKTIGRNSGAHSCWNSQRKYNNRGKCKIWREKEAWYQIEGSD